MNLKRERRLMRLMGLMPIYRQPRTSTPARGTSFTRTCCGASVSSTEPGVVCRHHVHPAGEGLLVSGGDHGLVEPQGSGVAAVQ